MDVSPIMTAPITVQVHLVCALCAIVLTPIMLIGAKGDRLHKVLGRVWVAAMAITALSSFAIQDIQMIGAFSPIHALSILTLYTLFGAIKCARAGRITAHKSHIYGAMAGLLGAGLFTLVPGRLMSEVLFKGVETQGFISAMLLSAAAIVIWRAKVRRVAAQAYA